MPGGLQPYTLLMFSGVLVILLVGFVMRRKPKPAEFGALGLVLIALLAAYLYIRPVSTPLEGEAAQVRALIGKGKPTLLEFQSPY